MLLSGSQVSSRQQLLHLLDVLLDLVDLLDMLLSQLLLLSTLTGVHADVFSVSHLVEDESLLLFAHQSLLLQDHADHLLLVVCVQFSHIWSFPAIFQRVQSLLQKLWLQFPHQNLVVDGLLVQLLTQVQLLRNALLVGPVYGLKFLQLFFLALVVVNEQLHLLGHVLLPKHQVLQSTLGDLEQVFGVLREPAAISVLLWVHKRNLVDILDDVRANVYLSFEIGLVEWRGSKLELVVLVLCLVELVDLVVKVVHLAPVDGHTSVSFEPKQLSV